MFFSFFMSMFYAQPINDDIENLGVIHSFEHSGTDMKKYWKFHFDQRWLVDNGNFIKKCMHFLKHLKHQVFAKFKSLKSCKQTKLEFIF